MGASDVAAWIALVISLGSLAMEASRLRRDRLTERRADIQARLELYEFGGLPRTRLVVRNYGPARATQVTAEITDPLIALPIFQIEVIQPNQDIHIPVGSNHHEGLMRVALSWCDGAGHQWSVPTVTPHHVLS